MYQMYANLHFHSTHSDGVYTPTETVRIAKEEGYKALALADHDTATGVPEFIEACKNEGMEYLVGTEFYAEEFGVHFHIVGLDFDPEHPKMKAHLKYASDMCVYRTKGLFDRGVERGTIQNITWEEVQEGNPGVTFLCVDHVFHAMKEKGVITDAEYTGFHRNNFSYKIPFTNIYQYKSAKEVISVINEAGGIAVIAHPGKTQMEYVPKLVELGLRGIEVWHPSHSDEVAAQAEQMAKEYNLYISGGTDHSGLMGGQYQYFEGKAENPYYVPSLKFGVTEENFRKIKDRVLG